MPAPGGAAPAEGAFGRPIDVFATASHVPPPRLTPDAARGLQIWLLLLLVLGVGGLFLGQTEGAGLVALAGLYIAAQAADLDPRWRLLYWMLTWVVPASGLMLFAGCAYLALNSPLPAPMRTVLALYSLLAAGICVLLALRRFGDPLTVRLFREDPPGHGLRLTMRLAVGGVLLAIPGALLLRDQFARFLEDSGPVITRADLVGQLVGMVVISLAGVGFLVRRDLRGTLDRLGLRPLTPRQILWVGAGAVLMFAVNAAAEQVQRLWFPDLWADDHAMSDMIARGLGPSEALLLGLTAGVGEELTLRGALQPRLGLVLTSTVFAALHVQYSWFGMLVILLLGLVLGSIRARSSTTVAILVHGLYDVLAVVTT